MAYDRGKGAYGADGDDTNYYLVEWTELPWEIENDGVTLVGDQHMQVFAGD